MKKILIFVCGSALLLPLLLLFADSPLAAMIGLLYGVVIWYSPRICVAVRKFWREYWKIIMKLTYKVR